MNTTAGITNRFLAKALALVAVIAWAGLAQAVGVKVSWNPNPETDIAGYELFVGTQGGVWQPPILTGNVTTYTVNGLDYSRTYYFGLKAFNTAGVRSDMSDVVAFTTPAPSPLLERQDWRVVVSSQETTREPTGAPNLTDGNPATFWHTQWEAIPPHYIRIELPRRAVLSSLEYLPRQDGKSGGTVTAYEIQVSDDGITWTTQKTGTWTADQLEKTVALGLIPARHVRLWGSDTWMSASEVRLRGVYEPSAPVTLVSGMESSTDLMQWTPLYSGIGPVLDKQFFRLFFHRSDGEPVKVTYQVESNPPQ